MSLNLYELRHANSLEEKIELTIKELYNLIDVIDSADKEIIKRYICYIIALLNGTFD